MDSQAQVYNQPNIIQELQPFNLRSTLKTNLHSLLVPRTLYYSKLLECNPEHSQQSMEVKANLDAGSQQSYVTQKVKDALTLKSHDKHSMSIMTFGYGERNLSECDLVRLGVATRDGMDQEVEWFIVPLMCQPLTSQPFDLCKSKYPHLCDLDLVDSSDKEGSIDVDLLIGSDYYWCIVTGDTRQGEGGPVAVHTRLGWVLSGTTSVPVKESSSHSHLITHVLHVDASPHCTEHLDEVLQSFWQLESLGIEDKGDSVLKEFAQSVCFRED